MAFNLKNALLSLALISAFSAPHAQAAAVTLDYTGSAFGYEAATITPSPNGQTSSARVSVGAFNMQVIDGAGLYRNGSSIIAWCVDVLDWLKDGNQRYTVGGTSDLAAFGFGTRTSPTINFSAGKVSDVQKLANQHYGDVLSNHNSEYSAAFQMALWEILFENSGAYALGNGSFTATDVTNKNGGQQTPAGLANAWLSSLSTAQLTGNYKLTFFRDDSSPYTQNLITLAPVPLPAAGVLMLSALGMGGLFMRRRAGKSASSAVA